MSFDVVAGTTNCTSLDNAEGVSVQTVEHLLAALAAVGIDNLIIEVDNVELPALDGSSEPFLKMIEEAGIVRQERLRRYIKVHRKVEFIHNGSYASIEPSETLELDVTIDFDDAVIGRQSLKIEPDTRAFRERLASARTFARTHEVAALREAGLSKGGSLDNAVIVDGDKVLNPEGLRFADEFVRHKALDLLGDIYLAGPILGKVTTVKGGHNINHKLLTALLSDKSAWSYETLPSNDTIISEFKEIQSRVPA